jgi:diguanylate cyclase (GGDEF)-like protein
MSTDTVSVSCPSWSGWVLENLPLGLLVLDSQSRVVFANQWFLRHARIAPEQILNKALLDVFPQLEASHLNDSLNRALTSGFPAVMSQTLHPAPFPLYSPGVQRTQDKFLRQSIRIIPVSTQAAQDMGQRYTLIQIIDVTQSVIRERLLKAQADKLKGLVNLDVLTGLGNRRLLDESLPQAVRVANKIGQPLSVIMFDIDFFKQYNDTYGHLAGDTCLQRVAEVLRHVFQRPQDVVTRFGGEELMAVLPETDGKGALALAETVLQQVRDLHIPNEQSRVAASLTLSAGVAVLAPGSGLTPTEVVNLADRALYSAKGLGRDRVCATQVGTLA